ncbi:MAG: hypothetical protein LBH81_02560 [Rickettsiales bacterium]|jgi:hypothetical protein|nr:hypothetical protein [Rickettsiales bacterium]
MPIFIDGRKHGGWFGLGFGGRKNPMMDLVRSYIKTDGPVYPFIPECKGYMKEPLAVVCDNGLGELPETAHPFMDRYPFMLDLHLRAGAKVNLVERDAKPGEVGLMKYIGAEAVSMDKETLDILNIDPLWMRRTYEWRNIVVNRGLHSVRFGTLANKPYIVDFKYHDGAENECTYESKREIIAGFASEYARNGYGEFDKVGEHYITRVFRDYWSPHLEYERKISNDEALEILNFRRTLAR